MVLHNLMLIIRCSVIYIQGDISLHVLVYADDLIIDGSSTIVISRFKKYINYYFQMNDMGSLKYFLAIEVARSPDGIFLAQLKYVLDVICLKLLC